MFLLPGRPHNVIHRSKLVWPTCRPSCPRSSASLRVHRLCSSRCTSTVAGEVKEAVRLCQLDATLEAELTQMRYLKAGLKKSLTTGQIAMGLLWLSGRILASCQEGRRSVDYNKMDEDFATLKKVYSRSPQVRSTHQGWRHSACRAHFDFPGNVAVGRNL